ncbi:MAG: hypothetical protein E5V89_11580 [Mesorhizobium sp.]|nr:MAG: hypothetical protein E5V89_11580 [Mesorhizobium sp.]
MHERVDAPFPPAQLAREEMLRFLSTGFAGPCCGESNEMLAYLEGVASGEKAPTTEPPGPRFRLRGLFSGLNLFPA